MGLENEKRYLIVVQQGNRTVTKFAYWFEERIKDCGWFKYTFATGFYRNKYQYSPYGNVIGYYKQIPKFTTWKIKEPIEGRNYLVYRVGSTIYYDPHYTIRKYHNGSFGSKDVKYWILLSDIKEKFIERF